MIAIKSGDIQEIKEEIAQYIAISLLNMSYFFRKYFIFEFIDKKWKIAK